MSKVDIVYLKHILDSIDDITEFTQGLSEDVFIESKLERAAVVRKFEVI